jgi:hypothetical protein
MQRRGGTGKLAKGRHTTRPKARKAATAHVSTDHSQEQLELVRERDEAREQQAATAEILRVIRASPTDVQPVFDSIAKSVARLCKAQFCHVFQFDGELIHFWAAHGYAPEVARTIRAGYPMAPGQGSAAAGLGGSQPQLRLRPRAGALLPDLTVCVGHQQSLPIF